VASEEVGRCEKNVDWRRGDIRRYKRDDKEDNAFMTKYDTFVPEGDNRFVNNTEH